MNQDVSILRALANEYAQIAAEMEVKHVWGLHADLNDLHPERPVVLIDELPWHELNADGFLTLRCEARISAGRRSSCARRFSGTDIFRAICS